MPSALSAILARIQNEPVVVTTLVGAVIALFVAYGVGISPDQKTAIIALVTAVLALFARSQVTPV